MIAGLPDAVMLRFFRRLYRYNKLIEMDKKNPVPTHIIDNEKEMIEKSTEELKEFGIQDADAFFLRSEVQASYVMFCVEEKLQDESYEHCCRCKKFLYRPPTVRCSLPHHPFDLYCKDFVDTGLAYHQRLTLHLARCGICKNITED